MNDPAAELASFQTIWHGGYYEGDPLDPHGQSSYSRHDQAHGYEDQEKRALALSLRAQEIGFVSTLYATYLACLKGKVRGKTVLEIGSGRGAWTKALLTEGARRVYALDALSAEHNGFYDYIGDTAELRERVLYYQVQDFSCSGVPDQSIDFLFTFGCLCHVSRAGVTAYVEAIRGKMVSGGLGYAMISDYAKVNRAFGGSDEPIGEEDQTPSPGRWYHLGTDWFCDLLEANGFTVLDRDVGCNLRDPVVHFVRD